MSSPTFCDDPSIRDDANLWRRVHPDQIVPDYTQGCWRISSAAFDDSELSIYLADEVLRANRSPEQVMASFQSYGLASITAEEGRRHSQKIVRDPQVDEPAHGIVFGRKRGSVAKRLSRYANARNWVITPPKIQKTLPPPSFG